MNRIKLFLLPILFLSLGANEWAYADNHHKAPIRFDVKVNSSGRPFIAFGHLKDQHLDVQESEMIMLNNEQVGIKKQLPAVLQIVSFSEIPVLVNGGEEVNLSIDFQKFQAPGKSSTARFKGANAFKQSIPYQMDSLYRISAERLATMNVGALKDYLSDKNQKVETLFHKGKITNQDERSLLNRYEGMLRMLVKQAFFTAHEGKNDLPVGFYADCLKEENFKGTDLSKICRQDIMDRYVMALLTGKSQPSDSWLKKWEPILADKNQFLIQHYILPAYRAMFRTKGLTPELDAFYSGLKLACTDDLLKELNQFYTYQANLMPGKPAPDFALRDLNGKSVRISDFKGKMMVIDCWGTWCSGCLKNLPIFEEVADRYKDSTNVVFITMALEAADGISWRNYIKEHEMEKGIHLQIINDPTDPTWVFLRNVYQMDMYPRYIAIDRQGNFLDCFLEFPMYPAFKEKIDQWYKEKR